VSRIAILGAGSWGTALAIVLSRASRPHEIFLWTRDANHAQSISRSKENRKYLPQVNVPAAIRITHSMAEALRGASIVIGAMPSAHARKVYSAAADAIDADAVIVSATKGLEPATHARMSEVVASTVPAARVAVLSGPSFALEVAKGSPTAVVIAASDAALAADLQEQFAAPNFRLYTNDDVLGVELAAAMKNVIAIASGTCQGLGLGANTLAALITRGLAELSRLAVALGGRAETVTGLTGIGDLLLTCTGPASRNYSLGLALGRGEALADVMAARSAVTEGVATAPALVARAAGVDMPICTAVADLLAGRTTLADAIGRLLARPRRNE